MVFDGRYKYIEGYKDKPQFFDLETDPLENHDLSTDPNAEEQRNRLKAHLQTQ